MSKKQHLSRLAAPKTWPIKRKGIKWVAKPTPGTHNLTYSLPAIVLLRDVLKLAKDTKEAKFMINSKQVIINSKPIRKVRQPVGLFDALSIPALKKHYRIVLSKKGKLSTIEIPEKEANLVPLKVTSKTTLKGNKTQLNFGNGWNLTTKEKCALGDSLLFNASSKKIEKRLKLDKGSTAFVTGGQHIGMVGTLKEIQTIGELRKKKIVSLAISKDEVVKTALDYIFIIGEAKPAIKVE